MTTASILAATIVLAVIAITLMVLVAIRFTRVNESIPAMTATDRPTHVVLWACGHAETRRCDSGCQHGDVPLPSIMRCGDCAREG